MTGEKLCESNQSFVFSDSSSHQVDNPITWDLDTRGLLPLGLGGKTNQERDSSGWDISFLEVGNAGDKT